ncbi:hypothetical protein ACWD0A_04225 [Streptomyces sp. NPDC002867]
MPEGPAFKRASDEDHRAIVTAPANRDPAAAAAANAAAAHVARTERWLHTYRPPIVRTPCTTSADAHLRQRHGYQGQLPERVLWASPSS